MREVRKIPEPVETIKILESYWANFGPPPPCRQPVVLSLKRGGDGRYYLVRTINAEIVSIKRLAKRDLERIRKEHDLEI